jgi:hypothetical protein
MNSLITNIRKSKTLKAFLPVVALTTLAMTQFAPCIAAGSDSPKNMPQGMPGIRSIALFPATGTTSADGQIASSYFDSALKLRLIGSGAYEVTSYNHRLPSVDRALNVDNAITQADLQEPITDPTAALKIAKVMGCDGYMLDEVDGPSIASTTGTITVTVSGNLFSTSTGAALRTFIVSGSASPSTPNEGTSAVLKAAVQNAVSQIVTTLGVTGTKSESLVPRSSYHQSASGSLLLVLLTGALIGVIAHNNNHPAAVPTSSTVTVGAGGTVSGGGGAPPPPPV